MLVKDVRTLPNLWDETIRCYGVYKKQTLRGVLSRAFISVPAAPCVVCGRITRKLCVKNWPIKRNAYWMYKAEVGEPSKSKVYGPRSCDEEPEIQGRGKQLQRMAFKKKGTRLTSDKHDYSEKYTWVPVVNHIAFLPATSGVHSSNIFMDSGTFCRVCNSTNLVMSE